MTSKKAKVGGDADHEIFAALLPDSRLEFIDCGHMFILTKLRSVVAKIEDFLCVQ